MKARPIEERFWEKVNKTDSCWMWTGSTLKGYGLIKLGHTTARAHRLAFEMAFGSIPNGMDVLHTCDTPGCVRSDHLFLGTQGDNNKDRNDKSRQATGFKIWSTKLEERDVHSIRVGLNAGQSLSKLAHQFGVSPSSIKSIRDGKTWKHLC